jgi:hypothetical protein
MMILDNKGNGNKCIYRNGNTYAWFCITLLEVTGRLHLWTLIHLYTEFWGAPSIG